MSPKPAAAMKGKIKPQKHVFHENILDIMGRSFRGDHEKGLAEWMKNSADAYAASGVADADQYIVLRFMQGKPKRDSAFECIDFVGTNHDAIDKAFQIWGDPTAAKRGKADLPTFGGHGNGGKFYMREMFDMCRMTTYQGGHLNVFGFDGGKYGFVIEDKKMGLDEALKFAGIAYLEIPAAVRARWKKSSAKAGFTVLRGEVPKKFSGKATVDTILEKLRFHAQARRLLAHKQVYYMRAGEPWGKRLGVPEISPRAGFEEPRVIPVPKTLEWNGETIDLIGGSLSKYKKGVLTLRTSEQPMSRGTEYAQLNSIDIIGQVGCLGTYRMHELGATVAETEFIRGECEMPVLEDKDLGCVANDRDKLNGNDITSAVIAWVREQVEALASEMAEKRKQEKSSVDLAKTSMFNRVLDKWKNKFMSKMTADIFGGPSLGDAVGGFGMGGEQGEGKKKSSDSDEPNEKKDAGDKPDGGGGGAGDKQAKGPKFPRVLLSSYDADPLDPTSRMYDCHPRHPPVHQRHEDVAAGIYWINTSRQFAKKLIETYKVDSSRWREYLFQRYIEIIVKQMIQETARREPNLTFEVVDHLMDKVTSQVHDAAATELETFLFNDSLSGASAQPMLADADDDATEAVAAGATDDSNNKQT